MKRCPLCNFLIEDINIEQAKENLKCPRCGQKFLKEFVSTKRDINNDSEALKK